MNSIRLQPYLVQTHQHCLCLLISAFQFVKDRCVIWKVLFLTAQIKANFLIRFHLQRFGGGKRDRTDDPLLAKQVLYQLSYAPSMSFGGSGRT